MAIHRYEIDPRLFEQHQEEIRLLYLAAVTTILDAATIAELTDLIANNRVQLFLNRIEDILGAGISTGSIAAYTAAGTEILTFIAPLFDIRVSFNQLNIRAVRQMQLNRLELIQGFNIQQQAVTRDVLFEGLVQGNNPNTTARRLRDGLELGPRFNRALQNFRNGLTAGPGGVPDPRVLDRLIQRKMPVGFSGRPADRFELPMRKGMIDLIRRALGSNRRLTADEIDDLTRDYATRLKNIRARTIARTETLRALNMGETEGVQQAIDSGALDPRAIQREWLSAGDPRVRDTHRSLNGQKRAWGVDFLPNLAFPGDPAAPASETIHCRCTLLTEIDDSFASSPSAFTL